jgi:hypothetical protein
MAYLHLRKHTYMEESIPFHQWSRIGLSCINDVYMQLKVWFSKLNRWKARYSLRLLNSAVCAIPYIILFIP